MIRVGSVLYIYIEEFCKSKYFIILGESDVDFTFASFYVNTDINYNFVPHKEVEKLHIVLKQSEYPFLKYDSYLNLNELFLKSKNTLIEEYNKNNKCLVYQLKDEQLYYLRKIYREQATVKGKQLKKYNFFEEEKSLK